MLKNMLWRKHASMIGTNIGMLIATVIISIAVCFATRSSAFETYEQSKVVVFSYVMCTLWVGLFDSLMIYNNQQSFVEADFDNNIYTPLEYLISVLVIELGVCLFQTVISAFIFFRFFNNKYNGISLITGSFIADFMITTFFIMFSAMSLGLLIGMVFSLKHITLTIPFVLIIQMLFSGCIFELSGDVLNNISNLVISKYGAGSIGALVDLNSYPFGVNINSAIKITQPYFELYRTNKEYIAANWACMVLLSIVPLILSYIVLRYKAAKTRR